MELPQPDFCQIFESAPGLYLILLPDLRIVAVSDAYLTATMTKRDQIIGKSLFEVFPDNPDDAGATGVSNLRSSLNFVLDQKMPHTMAVQKYDIRRPDGTYEERFWSPINKPVFDISGQLTMIIHRVEDVTSFMKLKNQQAEQKLLTDELQGKIAVMEMEVYKRAEEIQENNNRLLKEVNERKKAEEEITLLNKELESFTYSVSHDLRAPLRIIDGYAGIMVTDYQDKLDDEGFHTLKVIKRNAKRMGQLIDDLLNLSKVARKDLEVASTDMQQVVHTVLYDEVSYQKKSIPIVVEKLLPALCDSSLVRQVWSNLISNALKYSAKHPQPSILIRSYLQGGQVVYSIKDNGVGFDMTYAHKLFGVFQRLHKLSEFEGTGVGLALVQRIILRHGGRVWAESAVGKGAEFFFTLPAAADQN